MTTSEELRTRTQAAKKGRAHALMVETDALLSCLDVVDAAEKWRGAYERRQAWLAGNGEEPAQAGLVAAQADLALAVDAFRGERHEL